MAAADTIDELKELRKRLKVNKLTKADKKKLDELIASFVKSKALGTIGGRRVVARLPGGLDIIK
jgi:hypothetical protein